MKRKFLIMAALAAVVGVSAQERDERVLLTVNGEPETVEEFMYIYQKNNQESQVDRKSIDEYLDLFVNFKLKVAAAKEAGIDTTEAFRKELQQYRAQATPKYMRDERLEEAAIEKGYNRTKTDRRVSHIAIRCPESATAEEEAAAREKIETARVRVTTGLPVVTKKKGKEVVTPGKVEDFAAVATEVSEDPSAAENHGLIGWVRPFRFVYSFEEATYNTPVGEVSEVFRTPFGFHILVVEAEEPHREVHAAHIMKMTPRGNDSIAAIAEQQIDSLYKLAQTMTDEEFAQLAQENSDDRGSSMRGGDLGFFGRGQMVPEFEQAAFALNEQDSLSKPVKSMYGWHIIRLKERRGVQPLEEVRQDLERKVKRSEYQREVEQQFVEELKAQYHFTEDKEALRDFYQLAKEQTVGDSAFNAAAQDLHAPLFSFADQQFTQADFAKYIEANPATQLKIGERVIDEKYKAFVTKSVRDYEDSQLEKKYPDLKNLVTEYHDGILLFEVSLKEVWDKATTDTAGIKEFFAANKANYKFDAPRYKGWVLQTNDKATQKVAKRIIKSANPDSVQAYFDSRLNTDSVKIVKADRGLWKQGDNKAVDRFAFKQKKNDFKADEQRPVVTLMGKKIKGAEQYTDEKGKVTADYQDYLEREWVKRLREKYPVVINEEVLETLR